MNIQQPNKLEEQLNIHYLNYRLHFNFKEKKKDRKLLVSFIFLLSNVHLKTFIQKQKPNKHKA